MSKYLGLILATLFGSSAQAAPDWQIFNSAFQEFQGCYPADILKIQDQPEEGSPQTFIADDGATASMYGAANDKNISLAEEMKVDEVGEFGAGNVPVYHVLKPSYFAFSGFEGSNVVYEKTYLADGFFKTLYIKYPKANRAVYDSLVSHMSTCYKPVR